MTHATQINGACVLAQPRHRSDWSSTRIAELKLLFDDGLSHELIARKMGIGKGAISAKIDRLGWTRSATIVALKPDRTANAAKAEERRAQAAKTRAFEETIVGTPLLALNSHMCRWPMAYLNEQTFCGDPRAEGSPYCSGHNARAHTPPSPR